MSKNTKDQSIPEETSSPLPILVIAGAFITGILIGAGGTQLWGKSSTNQATLLVTPMPKPRTTSTPNTPPKPATITQETDGWTTYHGFNAYGNAQKDTFTIKFPATWLIRGSVLYPYGYNESKREIPAVVLGNGGKGMAEPPTIKSSPAGEADYWWYESDGKFFADVSFSSKFLFSATYIPPEKADEFKVIFDQMLSTLIIHDENNSPPSPNSPISR